MKNIVITSLTLIASAALAADWKGHASITYDLATADGYDVDPKASAVIAIGADAPDFFAFDKPAAHAQTPDPGIANHQVVVSPAVYEESQREAFAKSVAWHDFYLNAAITAMQQGHREDAAFLLGFAMHVSEDLGAHEGLPNLVHAAADRAGASPDGDADRLSEARSFAKDDLDEFRLSIGVDNWQLFKGDTVVRQDGTTSVPEPIIAFADLQSWDPHSGVIPASMPSPLATKSLTQVENQVLHDIFASGAQSPGDLKQSIANKVENAIFGLYSRQDAMLQILNSVPPTAANPNPPRFSTQTVLDIDHIVFDFFLIEPRRYKALSARDQKMLGETILWKHLTAERHQERLAWKHRILAVNRQRLENLRQQRVSAYASLQNMRTAQTSISYYDNLAQQQTASAARITSSGPPTIDAYSRQIQDRLALAMAERQRIQDRLALAMAERQSYYDAPQQAAPPTEYAGTESTTPDYSYTSSDESGGSGSDYSYSSSGGGSDESGGSGSDSSYTSSDGGSEQSESPKEPPSIDHNILDHFNSNSETFHELGGQTVEHSEPVEGEAVKPD